jgi:raffinose/stachyose/melibiose transport system permease protein
MNRSKLGNAFSRISIYTLVSIFSLFFIMPVLWLFYSSLKENKSFIQDPIGLPKTLYFENYIEAFTKMKFSTFFLNSVFNSIVAIFLICLFSFFIGYFVARISRKIMRVVYYVLLIGMFIPVYGLLIPTFIFFNNLNLLDNRFTLILVYVAFGLPLPVFLVSSFIRGIPVAIDEAAYLDGCNIHQLIFRVIMPLCKPIFATIIVISLLFTWNEFPYALVLLSSDKFKTIPVGLTYFQGQYIRIWTNQFAALVIASIPMIIVYIFLSKKIMEGMLSGSIKE